MTIKEKILAKIDELNLIKNSLLDMISFSDPNNESHISHTQEIADISGFTGVTPNNISEALTVLVEKINSYTAMISSLPNIETSTIYRDRGIYDFAIISDNANIPIPIAWEKISSGVSFESVQQQLPMSTYTGSLRKIEIRSFPTCRKGGFDSVDIDFEVVILRVNPRKNIIEEYHSGNGSIQLTIDANHLFGDDILIIGFRPMQTIIDTSIYYTDLTYTVKTMTDDGDNEHVFTIADTSVGNNILDCDSSLTNGILLWDMMTLNNFSIGYKNAEGNEGTIMPIPSGSDLGGRTDGNIIKSLSVLNISADVSGNLLSYRRGVSKRREMIMDSYSVYNKNENDIAHIVIKNIIPLDVVLEEVISAL